jgi:hypothetical protein
MMILNLVNKAQHFPGEPSPVQVERKVNDRMACAKAMISLSTTETPS